MRKNASFYAYKAGFGRFWAKMAAFWSAWGLYWLFKPKPAKFKIWRNFIVVTAVKCADFSMFLHTICNFIFTKRQNQPKTSQKWPKMRSFYAYGWEALLASPAHYLPKPTKNNSWVYSFVPRHKIRSVVCGVRVWKDKKAKILYCRGVRTEVKMN